jgi:2-oxoglutarate-Fe(II)-dependent oxygenase superfamily protein
MTAKQILDAFSETLMQDDRILSPRERELLTSILQNSKIVSSSNPELQSAVTTVIGRSVGETVAQRAFALLGGSIVEKILASSGMAAGTAETMPANTAELPSPQPPSTAPAPPSSPQPPNKTPQPPSHVPHHPGSPKPPTKPEPAKSPQPPSTGPSGIRPVGVPVQQEVQQSEVDSGSIGVLEAVAPVRAQCVVLDEFLAPQEIEELIGFTLQHEGEFQNSEVISPSGEPGVIDYNHRRSRVLMDLGSHQEIIVERIRGVLPRVLDQLGVERFPVTHVEAQITASNDGDFFREHSDDSHKTIASRRITFVYFLHREPSQFEGGELRIYDSRRLVEQQSRAGSYQSITPRQNQIVFFPCSLLHEITPVKCPSRAFADSRFTLNGWLHK